MKDQQKVFNWEYEIESNWSRDIKDFLYEINMQEDFVLKRVCYLNNVESKCIGWLNSISLKPQLTTYNNYKMEMKTKPYVKILFEQRKTFYYF